MTTCSITLTTMPQARPAAARARLRLTRRGRVVLVSALAVLLAGLMVVVAGAHEARGSDAPQGTVVVQQGQTLDALAAEHLPNTPRFEAVLMIDRANRLNSRHVEAGQVLVIPAE